jgi:hypothetical protein
MLSISLNQIAVLAKEIGAAGQPTHTYTQHAGTTYDTEGEAAYIPAQSLTPRPHITMRPGRVIKQRPLSRSDDIVACGRPGGCEATFVT